MCARTLDSFSAVKACIVCVWRPSLAGSAWLRREGGEKSTQECTRVSKNTCHCYFHVNFTIFKRFSSF